MKRAWLIPPVVFGLACGGLGSPEDPPAQNTPVQTESTPTAPEATTSGPEEKTPVADVVDEKPTVVPPPTPPISPPPLPPPAAEVQPSSITGSISRVRGQTVTLRLDEGLRPPTGTQGTLFKKVEQSFAGMAVSAWVDIGTVEVTTSPEGTAPAPVQVRIVERHSEVVVNGETQDYFVSGSTIRLEW